MTPRPIRQVRRFWKRTGRYACERRKTCAVSVRWGPCAIAVSWLLVGGLARAGASDVPAAAAEQSVTRIHALQLSGKTINFTSTAGTLVIRDAHGQPDAAMFYVAYTVKPTGATPRPVTFIFNGGPGSASLWLHLGSVGPWRLANGAPVNLGAPPYGIVANDETLLDRSDLVFIDAVGTGYSRALPADKATEFFGVDADADSFTRFVIRYLDVMNRWNSPRFLFGESYGATRAAIMLDRLRRRGVYFNGAILQSAILNFASYHPGVYQGAVNFLPSLAAVAWYQRRQSTPEPTAAEDGAEAAYRAARDFAAGPYAAALLQGDRLSRESSRALANQMASLTSLSAEDIERWHLQINPDRFCKRLLASTGRVVSRLDGRYTAHDSDAAGDAPNFDAADAAVSGAFVAAQEELLHGELGFSSDVPYVAVVPGLDDRWNWQHQPPGGDDMQTTPDVGADLADAMRADPSLRVLVLGGLYDLETPLYAVEYDLAHLAIPSGLRRNLTVAHFESGHLIYLDPGSLHAMRQTLGRFLDEASHK